MKISKQKGLPVGKDLANYIDEVESKFRGKIIFKDKKLDTQRLTSSNTFADIDKAIVYFTPEEDYSNPEGQNILAEEVTHIHFHKNLKFKHEVVKDLKMYKRRLITSISSLAEDIFVHAYLEKKGIIGFRKRYGDKLPQVLKSFKRGYARADPENQEAMKRAAYIYLIIFARANKLKRKIRKEAGKYLGKEELRKLDVLIRECDRIIKRKLPLSGRYLLLCRKLLKHFGLLEHVTFK